MAAFEITDLIAEHGARLTGAERRVAQVVLDQPQLIAFGTVADLAAAANAGASTVVRFAGKLGFDGFGGLQESVQRDLATQLRPAAERIREPDISQPLDRHRAAMIGNVEATLDGIDPTDLEAVVALLADLARPVLILGADAVSGVAAQLHRNLSALRPGVHLLAGSDVTVRRQLAEAGDTADSPAPVLVVIDFRRYERWILDVVEHARGSGTAIVACTDGRLSPFALAADVSLVLAAASHSPFESHVGTLALFELLVAFVAERLRDPAAARLARADRAWASGGSLTDG